MNEVLTIVEQMQVIILGPPGVGKGTQSELIAQKLGLIHLSTGEILRDAVNEGTPLGLRAKAVIESGALVSDEIMIGIIKEAIQKEEMKNGFILDGFPRTITQAIALDALLEEIDCKNVKVVYLSVPKEELITRLTSRGRKDDNIDTVLKRMEIYKEQTAPVREHYRHKNGILEVDGVGSIDEINENVVELLKA